MSNPGNSKSLRIKLRDPVEGSEKTFGSVGMGSAKVVVPGVETGSESASARIQAKMMVVGRVDMAVGSSRGAKPLNLCEGARFEEGVEPSLAADVEACTVSKKRRERDIAEAGDARAREGALQPGFEPGSGEIDGQISEGADSRGVLNGGSFSRREIIESWSDDVEVRNNVNICPTVDEADSSRRRYGRRVVDFGSNSDDSNQAPLASDHAEPSSEVELTDEEEEEDDIPPGDVEVDTRRQKKNKPINLDLVNFDSVLTEEHLHSIRRLSGAPSNVELLLPRKGDRLYSPPDGFHTVFLGYLTCTSQITPHLTLLKVCEEFKIGYSQLTPTVVLMFQAFHFRVVRVGLPVSVSLFKALFTLHRPNKMPFFCFHPRVPYQFVKSVKLSLGKWKTYFFLCEGSHF
ncbi:PREDICTED: uncharacterized protein LOC105958098 [Erythranthe guttata]|uniref:uncharacterized protein LOC105958098 n=1 Tax=Erythranthe guttata TaxID=4155 RepID=UPI00064D93E0|nr:PREDICTED: uncharacterized protein LOC105958098 [Erythranthe guttata]|eukprot:XP_012837556.1 PREDICTED: uncharacterized protein LOC105958098 [Erythranthe guttata]